MSASFAIGEMTSFETVDEGAAIRFNMEDVNGRPISLRVPLECLTQLIMTLPGMVQQAVQRRYQDPTLRIVYPVAEFRVELGNDLDTRILTLSTPDGFGASFGLSETQCREIGTGSRESCGSSSRLAN